MLKSFFFTVPILIFHKKHILTHLRMFQLSWSIVAIFYSKNDKTDESNDSTERNFQGKKHATNEITNHKR